MRKESNVFVKVAEYNDLLDIIALINEKVKEARIVLGKIYDLKNQEDSELDAWKNSLDDVERKLKYIDQVFTNQNINMADNDFYVGIYEPQDIRRNVLESSRELVSTIQSKRNLDSIRHAKMREYENMRRLMDELNFLLSKLKTKLPSGVRRQQDTIVKDEPSPGVRKLSRELDKLEQNF